jgi:nitrile hydratase subunit alpha
MNERFKFPADREARNAARTKALEFLLIEKGVITGETVDKVLGVFETKMGPFNGARLVARAWVDPAFKERLVADTPPPSPNWIFRKAWPARRASICARWPTRRACIT